jgi:hypothetical protein
MTKLVMCLIDCTPLQYDRINHSYLIEGNIDKVTNKSSLAWLRISIFNLGAHELSHGLNLVLAL